MKILTISIAAYNVEKYLKKALSSLNIPELSTDLEVIIEDDGSFDKTASIARSFVKKNPEIFKLNTTQNGGYGATINRSISIATGKYFKQLDGDDWFITENIFSFINFLKKIDSDLVISPYKRFNEKSENYEIVDRHKASATSENINTYFEEQNIDIHLHELTIKTEILSQNHISIQKHCFFTDNEYVFYPILYSKTISFFDKPIYCYRIGTNEQSVSINGRKKHWKDAGIVLERLINAYNAKQEAIDESKKKNLFGMLLDLTRFEYENCAITDNLKESIPYLKNIDFYIKVNNKKLYSETNKRYKSIKLLRKSKFYLLPLYRRYLYNKLG